MRRIGLVGVLLGALLLGGVGIAAYQLGVTAGATAEAVESGATVVVGHAWGWGPGFGFPFFGLFFGLLFLVLVVGLVRWAAFGRRGPGGPRGFGPGGPWSGGWEGGRGSWGPGTDRPVPPPVAEMLGQWHAQAHGAGSATAGGSAGTTGPAPTGTADPARPGGSAPA